MITKENISEILNMLDTTTICEEHEKNGDFVSLTLLTFNVGSTPILKVTDYDEQEENEILSNGGVYLDRDNFGILIKKSGTTNEILKEFFT